MEERNYEQRREKLLELLHSRKLKSLQYELEDMNEFDIAEFLTELGEEDKRTVERARRIQQFFSQPFSVAEQFTGLEGRYVKLEDTLRSFETILGGELDKYPEAAFSNVGNVDEVIAKAKKMGAV